VSLTPINLSLKVRIMYVCLKVRYAKLVIHINRTELEREIAKE